VAPENSSSSATSPRNDDAPEVPSGYKWPASRLSNENMRRLTILSNRVKRPINQLIKEAVESYTAMMIETTRDDQSDRPGK
jgi:hypothetical protein